MVKNLPAMQETRVQSLGWEDPLEKTMATYSSILAWWVPWTEEPGRLQYMGLQRVRHDWVTNTHTFTCTHTHTHTHTHRHRELRGIPDGSVSIDLIFSIVFLVSFIFTSALIFVISFLPLNLGFICSTFSSSLRWKLGCLFKTVLIS